jgi:hypothetical protein
MRVVKCLLLSAVLAGCDSGPDPFAPASGDPNHPAFASAGTIVDPNTLTPVPPPGAVCRADGNGTICHTEVSFAPVNEPQGDLTCGTVYGTGTDNREGIRWYNTDDKLVKRFVQQHVDITLTLSSLGLGPTVWLHDEQNWTNLYAVPGDLSTESQVSHGDGLKIQAPGVGVIVHDAGISFDEGAQEGVHHGILRDFDDPAVLAELCAALTP